MKKIGIFEAKTKFPSLCTEVARTGSPVLVQRRGKPLVMVTPVPEGGVEAREDILTAWRHWMSENPEEQGEFPEVWRERRNRKQTPLEA